MKPIIGGLVGFLIGVLLASIGYGYWTWQFWALWGLIGILVLI